MMKSDVVRITLHRFTWLKLIAIQHHPILYAVNHVKKMRVSNPFNQANAK